ncbi:MAG: peptidoglycan-binding protein [Actinomycetota bacterium]
MRLYRLGDGGESIRDIQDRLLGLGMDTRPDPRGEFGDGTRRAVLEFQRSRGLGTDGIVGPDTWRALYEAGYRLGDRLLFLRRPMLRGDDVAELQSRLNNLGFDAGKVDGVFGSNTQRAVLEFQRNRYLAEDGKAGPEVITEIRLVTRAAIRAGREAVRELEWLRTRPATMVGARIYLDSSCRDEHEAAITWTTANAAALALQERGGVPLVSRSHDVVLPERVRAQRANRMGAELVVSFGLSEEGADAVYFFSSGHGRSEVGHLLATAVADRLGSAVEGRATPMLKETRAPAIVVHSSSTSEKTALATVDGIEDFLARPAR